MPNKVIEASCSPKSQPWLVASTYLAKIRAGVEPTDLEGSVRPEDSVFLCERPNVAQNDPFNLTPGERTGKLYRSAFGVMTTTPLTSFSC